MIYGGFPMRLCLECEEGWLWGFWSWVPGGLIPFNGFFMLYEGSYIKALWGWLTRRDE